MITAIVVLGGLLAFCVLALGAWAVLAELGASAEWPGAGDDGLTITEAMYAELLARSDALEHRIRAPDRVIALG